MDIMRGQHLAQLLSTTIDAVGCLPRDSLMLLVMRGRVANAIMRVDLPPEHLTSDELVNWARSVTGLLASFREADGLAVISCRDIPYGRGPEPPGGAVVAVLGDIAGRAGLRSIFALGLARDGWGMYGIGGVGGAGPRSRDELSGIAREGAFRDMTAVRCEAFIDEQLAARIARVRAEGEHSFARWRDALDRTSGGAMAPGGIRRRVSPEMLPDADAVAAASALGLLASGRMPEMLADAIFASGEYAPGWSQALDWALGGHRPEPVRWLPRRVTSAVTVLTRVHGACDGHDRSRVALCLGWLEWARGRGSAATGWARWCLAQPGNTGSGGDDDREAGLLLLLAGSPLIAPWVRDGTASCPGG